MSASDLVKSCIDGVFPTLSTMSKYGIDGHNGTNPIHIFKCYATAVNEGKVSSEDIENTKDLNELIMKYNKTKKYFEQVKQAGGIQVSVKLPTHVECTNCNYCGITHESTCPNCQLKF